MLPLKPSLSYLKCCVSSLRGNLGNGKLIPLMPYFLRKQVTRGRTPTILLANQRGETSSKKQSSSQKLKGSINTLYCSESLPNNSKNQRLLSREIFSGLAYFWYFSNLAAKSKERFAKHMPKSLLKKLNLVLEPSNFQTKDYKTSKKIKRKVLPIVGSEVVRNIVFTESR